MCKRILLSIFLFICLTGIIDAKADETPYSIDALMKAAISNRALVDSYETVVKKGREDLNILSADKYPSFDAGFKVNQLNDDIGSESRENSAWYTRLSYNIFDGYLNKFETLSKEKQVEADALRVKIVKQDIMLMTGIQFLLINRNVAYWNVTREAVKLYKDKYDEAVLKHKVGLFKKADLLKIKVELDNAEQEERRAKAAVNKSINDLSHSSGVNLNINDINLCCLDELPETTAYGIYEKALLSNRSELHILSLLKDAASYGVSAKRAAFYPRVDASMGLTHYEDDYLPLIGDRSIGEFRLTIEAKINLFDGYKKQAALRKQKHEIKKVDYELAELKSTLLNDLKNEHIDFMVAKENVETAKTGIEQADENLRVTEFSYKKGLSTATDILDAIIFQKRAKFNVIDAKFQVFSNYIRLLRSSELLGSKPVLEKP